MKEREIGMACPKDTTKEEQIYDPDLRRESTIEITVENGGLQGRENHIRHQRQKAALDHTKLAKGLDLGLGVVIDVVDHAPIQGLEIVMNQEVPH